MVAQRIRTIKPEFFVHEGLAGVSFIARLLYVGMWTIADRDGRLEDRPRRLKALLFPYDPVDIDAALEELASAGFVRRYVVEGHACIDIPTFSKHQRPNVREPLSQLPACPDTHVHARARTCVHEPPARAQGTGKGIGREEEREREGSLASLAHRARAREDDAFPQFWALYPRHEGKKAALKAWQNLGPDPPLEAIRKALEWQRNSPRWVEQGGQFIPHPATYLNGRRWEDEPLQTAAFGTTARTAGNAAAIARGLGLVPHGRD